MSKKPAKAAKNGPSEEVKAKFRQALDKKQAHGGKDASVEGEGKVHDAHGPVSAQRMFRRKAGG